MKLTRIMFFAMAVTLPTTWTVAMAGDEAPPAEGAPAKEKKGGKKAKKEDKPKEEKKAE